MMLDPETDVILTEEILLETDARLVRSRIPGSRKRTSNLYLGAVVETSFALIHYGDPRMTRTDRVIGRVDFPAIEIKGSRSADLHASYMMSEPSAAEKVNAIIFVSAVVGVRAGDPVMAGMVCRFFRWEWRPFFLRSGEVRRYRNGHATIQVPKELAQPMHTMRRELAAFHKAFHRREKRRYRDNEVPPPWLEDFACERLGIWSQDDWFEAA